MPHYCTAVVKHAQSNADASALLIRMKLQREEVMESVSNILNLSDQTATVRQHINDS